MVEIISWQNNTKLSQNVYNCLSVKLFTKLATPLNKNFQHSFIMGSTVSCRFRSCIARFYPRYNAASHDSNCEYVTEISRNVSASENRMETPTHVLSALTDFAVRY